MHGCSSGSVEDYSILRFVYFPPSRICPLRLRKVTFGLCLVGALPWIRGCLLGVVQILGGIVAAAIVSCLFPGNLTVGTKLSGGTSIAQGVFIEMFLTAELVFTIFMLAAEKHRATFIAPVGIGLALFIAHLTGQFRNPISWTLGG